MRIYAEPYVQHEIEDFIKRKVRSSSNKECTGLHLFNAYKKWCREYNTLPKSRFKFYNAMENKFDKVKDKKYGIVFLRVKLI